jgi:uncharacterized protein YheU (UPF0270 family)
MPKLCNFLNCRKRASYGKTRTSLERCVLHKENMKLCAKICNCGKSRPSYNDHEENVGICCKSCKTDSMVNIVSKKCKCGKAIPIYNEPGESNPVSCKLCKTTTMVDVKYKKCKCGKAIPIYNEPGETIGICCKSCKTDSMVNIVSKKCKCGKAIPIYNEPGETIGICCKSCKTETMVNVKNKKCKCGKARPNYNNPGETIGICCKSCKTESMTDIIHKKCLGCINSEGIINECPYKSRGNPKYKNYCTECFKRNFPLDPLTFQIRSKTKEIAVRDFINTYFDGFQHNRHLLTGHCDCSIRRSIDHRKLIGNTLLAIETDENQHKGYDKMDEETRYDDLYMAHSGKWIYIRFNPDKYINKNGISKNPAIATRLLVLKNEIEKQIQRIEHGENYELVERIYMYYDGYE